MKGRAIQQARLGATFLATRSTEAVRALVAELIEDNPRDDFDALFFKFEAILAQDEAKAHDVHRYAFANFFRYEESAKKRRPNGYVRSPSYEENQAKRAERDTAVKSAAVQVASQICLLLLTMPNGKALKYCTGPDLEKFGKGYAKIARRVGSKTVGEVLNEDEVRELMG